ncbi:MAG TPA: hypothetical protein VFR37_16175 [Longimicrobium sp.]|nr:hypothetical protein [Longimicrobium sp.]
MKTIMRLSVVLLLIVFSGCTRFRVRTLPQPEEAPVSVGAVRVTPRETGMMVVLRNVQVTADSVIGWRAGDPEAYGFFPGPSQRVALHRDQVLVYEPAVHDGWATAGGVVLGIVVAYGLAVLYAISHCC